MTNRFILQFVLKHRPTSRFSFRGFISPSSSLSDCLEFGGVKKNRRSYSSTTILAASAAKRLSPEAVKSSVNKLSLASPFPWEEVNSTDKDDDSSSSNAKRQQPKKEPTIQDFTDQARRARQRAEQDPQAGEKLHQRIMAEEAANDANDDPTSKLFQEALTDPEKAWEFWNKDFLENKRRETAELERILDERMKMVEELMEKKTQDVKKAPTKQDSDPRDAFFANTEQGKEFQKSLEEERKVHAKNVELFYSEAGEDWYSSSNKGKAGSMKKEPKVPEISSQDFVDGKRNDNKPQNSAKRQKRQSDKDIGDWVLVEDPTTSDEPFYWNSVTDEMRSDLPDDSL